MRNNILRPVLILVMIGTFVSAQQVSSETVFDREDSVELEELVVKPPEFVPEESPAPSLMRGDTLQTIEIEIEEKKESNIYKEIAMVAIVAGFVGYLVVTLFFSGDDEGDGEDGGGKELPTSRVLLFNQ